MPSLIKLHMDTSIRHYHPNQERNISKYHQKSPLAPFCQIHHYPNLPPSVSLTLQINEVRTRSIRFCPAAFTLYNVCYSSNHANVFPPSGLFFIATGFSLYEYTTIDLSSYELAFGLFLVLDF